ncbi:hypothetical protein [Halovulum sp. GXIMD14793]
MFDFTKPFGNASLVLLVSAALHLAVIAVSLGGYLLPMIIGALLWLTCASLLQLGNRWLAGLVFLIAIFAAATVPLAYAMSETGLISMLFFVIVLSNAAAALALFAALWTSGTVAQER